MIEKVRNLMNNWKPEAEFDKSQNFIYDGILDSLDIMELISLLEDEFEIVIDFAEVVPERFYSFGSISEFVGLFIKKE